MIDELIIMRQDGDILFYNNYTDAKCDHNLLPNLFAALQQFAETILRSDLKEIKFEDNRYVFLKDRIAIAARTGDQHASEKVREIIVNIKDKFIEKFGMLNDFSGEMTTFNSFENELSEILPNKTPKISSQDLLEQFFGIKINGKKILNAL
ncbi:MAG: hypothetical protein ACFFCD_00120 [Promethearchaeota archaeon]